MFCKNCGTKLEDNINFCPVCGCNQNQNNTINQTKVEETSKNDNLYRSDDHTIRMISFIFCLLATIFTGWLILPLAWCIPLTIRCYNWYKYNRYMGIGVKICILLFVSQIGGILALVDN